MPQWPPGFVTLNSIQTLTNKTLVSPVITTPSGLTKSDVGLENVDNTSDIDKPISAATQLALDEKLEAVDIANKADLVDGKVPSTQLPSYVDDVLEYPSSLDFPEDGESGKIYVALDSNLTYRWTGSTYTEISQSIALGETNSTAYRGDHGKIAYDHSQLTSGNPHNVTKSDLGLGNVENTSDMDKPVSTAQQAAIDTRSTKLVSISGLALTIRAFKIGDFEYTGGSITAIPNMTQYLCINLRTKAIHTLSRNIGDGEIYLAKIVASASGVIAIDEFPLRLPRTLVPMAVTKIQLGQKLKTGCYGTSLVAAGTIPTYGWQQKLFNPSLAADGFFLSTGITNTNRSVGGSNSRYTAALFGRAVVLKGTASNFTTSVFDGYNPHPERHGIAGINDIPHGDSLCLNDDLFIVGLLPNTGTDRLDVFEGIIKQLRKDRREVLLVTDNTREDGAGTIRPEGFWVRRMANKYGCAVADTDAYMEEGQLRGESVYLDGIHQNNNGQLKWAEPIAGVLGHGLNLEPLDVSYPPQVLDRLSQIQHRVEVELNPTIVVNTGTATKNSNMNAGLPVNRLSELYGETSQTWDLTVGARVVYHHPLAIACDLIVDSSSAFKCNQFSNGVFQNTITHTTVANPIMSNYVLGTFSIGWASGINNRAGHLEVTEGTMRICAVVYHVPDYEDVTSKIATAPTPGNAWNKESAGSSNGYMHYTDQIGDWARVQFNGASLYVLYKRSPAAGTVTQYMNGKAISPNLVLTDPSNVYVPAMFNGNQGLNTFLTRYTAASAGTPTTSDRRLGIVQILAIKDRFLVA